MKTDNLSKKQFLAHKQIKKFTEENFSLLHLSKEISQRLTHQQISGRFMHIILTKKISPEGYKWVLKEDINLPLLSLYVSVVAKENFATAILPSRICISGSFPK